MKLTSLLFRAARLSADFDAGEKAVRTGSMQPIWRRLVNKLIGRYLVGRIWWR